MPFQGLGFQQGVVRAIPGRQGSYWLERLPLLNGIVDDTLKITFRFVRELVAGAGAAPRPGLAIYPFAYVVDDGFAIADFSGLQVGATFFDGLL